MRLVWVVIPFVLGGFFIWFLFAGSIDIWYQKTINGTVADKWICEQSYPEYYKTDEYQCWKDWINDPFKDSPVRIIIKP